jgi:hypothetical protein
MECGRKWLEYQNKQLETEIIRLKQGEMAYLRAQQKLIGSKPICDGYAMSLSDSLRLSMDRLEHTNKAIDLSGKAKELTSATPQIGTCKPSAFSTRFGPQLRDKGLADHSEARQGSRALP